jgi:hypothetical protein
MESKQSVPSISISRNASGVALIWPFTGHRFVLETSETVDGKTWTAVPGAPRLEADQYVLPINLESRTRFFRLKGI